jgi:hypothetical protein
MDNILSSLLKKKGIKDASELTPEERQDFDKWKKILSEEVSVETIKEFCKYQISIVESRFASGDNTDKQDAFLKASLNVYLNLLKAIEAPKLERENLERYLHNLIT